MAGVAAKQDVEEPKSQQFELHRQQVLYAHMLLIL